MDFERDRLTLVSQRRWCFISPPVWVPHRPRLFHIFQSKEAHFQLILSVGDQLPDLTETNRVFHLVYLCMYGHVFMDGVSHQVCVTRTTGSAPSARWLKREYKSKKSPFKILHRLDHWNLFFCSWLPWSSRWLPPPLLLLQIQRRRNPL